MEAASYHIIIGAILSGLLTPPPLSLRGGCRRTWRCTARKFVFGRKAGCRTGSRKATGFKREGGGFNPPFLGLKKWVVGPFREGYTDTGTDTDTDTDTEPAIKKIRLG
jgi:hypothetical protein